MCLLFYMCFFDCKCKSLKRLGENIKKNDRKKHKQNRTTKGKQKNINTGYPAHEPPRINRTNYSRRFVGWIYCIYVFMFSFELFLFFCYVSFCLFCFRLVFLSFCIYNRTNIYKNITKQNNSKENKKKHKQIFL